MRRNRNPPRGSGSGGNLPVRPFISDHLKDIDLELDLLKRKREMLERQQIIQPLMQPQQRNFTQQPFYQLEPKQSGSNRDFSHLYNDGSQHFRNEGSQQFRNDGPQQFRKLFGKKRQSDSEWQHNSYPKRSTGSGPRGSSYAGSTPARNQRPFPNQNQPKSTSYNYGQGKQSIGQRIGNQKQQNPKPAKPLANKVTKPSKAPPPNKLASQPAGNRNQLVAAAMVSMAQAEREALTLLPDKVPTKLMTGRLELALGAILRDVRDRCAESSHEELLRSPAIQRVIKQAIRERIRTAMLGKVVGHAPETIKEYRAMYPKNTDIEIVNIALEAGGIKPESDTKVIVADKPLRPDQFFKKHMMNLINTHLGEVFTKIEEIYKKENEIYDQENAQDGQKVQEEANPENEQKDDAANVEPEPAANAENVETKNENVEGANESDNTVKAENVEGASNENAEGTSTENVEATEAKTTEAVNGDSTAVKAKKNGVEELLANAHLYKRLLPQCLKRNISTILNLLSMNKTYARAVADLTDKTRNMLLNPGEAQEIGPIGAQISIDVLKKQPYVVLPYYVKIMGKPQLPKKHVMNTFLDVFHPKSIKKHRSIHNLLFIGFTEKSDYDAIVQADGTVIGRSTLSIRVCDKAPDKPANNQANTTTDEKAPTEAKTDAHNTSATSDVLGKDLDNQITDLLTSVEGENVENAEESAAQEDVQGDEGAEEFGDDENGTVDNVDEVFDNIEAVDEDGDQNGDAEMVEDITEPQENQDANVETTDQVAELKTTGAKGTPSRASARLSNTPATPSSIRTRRSSRQIQN